MKAKSLLFTIVLTAGCVSLIGCKEKPAEPATPPTPKTTGSIDIQKTATDAKAAAEKAAADAQAAASKAVTDAKAAADKAAADAKAQATAATAQFQTKIDQAKSLMGQKKYPDAMSILQQLSAGQLSADQKSLVDQLMAQLQQLMAAKATTEAVKSTGGLLKK